MKKNININIFFLNLINIITQKLKYYFFINKKASQKIKKLFFEWNDLQQIEKRGQIFASLAKVPYVDNLVMRCNNLRDDMTVLISQSLLPTATTSSNLKFIDLYDNQIGIEGFNAIGTMIYKNKSLQTLGLAKNNISDISSIEKILISIGRYPMTEEQYLAYRESEKQRDLIIEKNKKLKGKKALEAEPVPELESIEQISENKWAISRNNTLSMLNLSLNQLGDESVDRLEQFLPVTHENFQIILTFNKFEQRSKDKLKKRFTKKIAL